MPQTAPVLDLERITMAISILNFLTQSLKKSRFFGWNQDIVEYTPSASPQPSKSDPQLWDEEIGTMLSDILRLAGYPSHSRLIHEEFFRESVAPSLGPHPRGSGQPEAWKSFMTDDNSPVELSWCWSTTLDTPTARYSVEPIGKTAGLASDPTNSFASVRLLGNTLPLAPDVDLYLHRHFQQWLTSRDPSVTGTVRGDGGVAQSQSFMAFDLMESVIVVKQYYLPTRRALAEGKSNAAVVEEAIHKLPAPASSLASSLSVVTDFLHSLPVQAQPEVEIMALDCLDSSQSRLKIYVRARTTSFRSVIEMLTLGGTAPMMDEEEESLRELWRLVLGLKEGEYKDEDELPAKDHRTGGILYYYELKSGRALPKSKVYLPVRHYAHNDDQIARGLSAFLDRRGKKLATGTYYDGVKQLCQHRDLSSGLGFHTYISWASARNCWNVTSYFNPEIYHARRFEVLVSGGLRLIRRSSRA